MWNCTLNYTLPYRNVLFFSRPRSEEWPHHGPTSSIYLCPVILTDSSTGSPAHALMLTIQAVRCLPRLRAPGIATLHYLFLQATPLFPHGVNIVC